MTSEQAVPQLTFEIDSAGARNTIYVTADPSVNDITFTIGTTATATFTPAPAVVPPPEARNATGSLVYLDLSALNLTQGEFDAIAPDAPGWRVVLFPADHVLGMTPDDEAQIGAGQQVGIRIGALAASRAQGASASLVVRAYRVAGITVGDIAFPGTFTVALATPLQADEPLPPDLVIRLLGPDVVNTVLGYNEMRNQLEVAFLPGDRGRLVYASEETEFRVSFVYATDPSGYGALCTTDQARQFAVRAGDSMAGWTITPNLSQQSPYWSIRPPAGQPIVGRDEFSTPWIVFDNVITTFQPGPTVALVSYSGIQDYADGVFTLLIAKHPHVRIDSLAVTPNPAVLDDGSAEVTITWTARDAGRLVLAPFQVDVTGRSSYPARITESTKITLTAEGTHLASMGNLALRNATAGVLPVINSFEATPRSVLASDLPRYVLLGWNVNTNDQLELLSSAGLPDPARYGPFGEVEKRVPGPRMYTLRSLGEPGTPVAERSVIVSAFTPQARTWPVRARHLAAPPNASFVVASDGDTVTAVDTMAYQPVSGPVPTGDGPAGMAFSASGEVLYVANSRGGTVSVIAVRATGDDPPYEFTEIARTPVGGRPQRLALSPDGAYLYVTVDRGAEPGLLAVLSTDGVTASMVTAVETGAGPRGLAVTPSGAQVFVANSGDSTVTVAGRAPDGRHSYAGTVSGTESASDVAVTSDGGVLLVACPPLGAVLAINAVHPGAARKLIRTGAAPRQIALVPSGAYAAVACAGDGTVSLLAVGGTPGECRAAGAGITVGGAPEAVAVTPDAGLVLAGSGDGGLSVITLAEYQTAADPRDIGGQPTNVVITPDRTSVVAWHNARKSYSVGEPSTGLYVYDIGSATVTQQLDAVPVVAAAFDPVPENHAVYLAEDKRPVVTVLDSGTWEVTRTIDLSGQSAGLPVALAFAAATLFVVVQEPGTRRCELLAYRIGSSGPEPAGTLELLTATAGSAQTLAVAADGSRAYVTDQGKGQLLVAERGANGSYALRGGPVEVGRSPVATALSPDGASLFVSNVGGDHGVLAEVDTTALTMRRVALPSRGYTTLAGLAVSPDGSRLLAADQAIPGVRIFDAASLRLVQTIVWRSGVEMPTGIAVAHDGSRIFTANVISGNLGIVSQVQATATTDATVAAGPGLVPAADPYRGLYLRDYVGQTPETGNRTGDVTNCCDIWPAGLEVLPNPRKTLVEGYDTNSPNVLYTNKDRLMNYIYVRGKSTIDGAATARVWLYYLNGGGNPSLILWPPQWLNDGMRSMREDVHYIEVPLAKLGDICYTEAPFGWYLQELTNGHYCVIAVVENPPLSDPPLDPRAALGAIGRMDQLAAFIANRPNLGWKNTVQKKTQPEQTWTQYMSLKGPQEGGLFSAGVRFRHLGIDPFDPKGHDSAFSFTIVGPDGIRRGFAKTPLTNDSQIGMVELDWTGHPGYQTDFTLNYFAGKTPLPQGAEVTAIVGIDATRLVGLVRDPMAGAFRAPVVRTNSQGVTTTSEMLRLVGTVRINLT
jgi:DNA-binding beta-propeller fold protein YncE